MRVTQFLTPGIKACIKFIVFSLKRIIKRRKKVVTNYSIVEFCSPRTDTFFGYYDITPFNSNEEVIYVEHHEDDNSVDIVLNTVSGDAKKVLAASRAWNWQQACRLRWLSNDEISFNDFHEGDYVNRIIDVRSLKEKILPFPLYDIDKNRVYGLNLNFDRLGKLRPGYGYTCKESFCEDHDSAAISLVDINTCTVVKQLSYKEIGDAFKGEFDIDKCYVNHLSFSPDGKLFMFFWIEIINGYHKALMGVYDIDKNLIIPLELEYKVSHYVWLDNNRILCTIYLTPSECKYYVYNISEKNKQPYCEGCLKVDGHPSVYDDQHILTDTYPDADGYQYLRLVDESNDSFKNLAEVFSVPVSSGERRTDLHPRFNSSKKVISFDANVRGYRSLFVIKEA